MQILPLEQLGNFGLKQEFQTSWRNLRYITPIYCLVDTVILQSWFVLYSGS